MRFPNQSSALGIKVTHPDLGRIGRFRRPDQFLSIRREARSFLMIRRFAHSPSFAAARRNDPQVRSLCVRLKIDIGRGEHDPFSVGRWHRFVHPFEFHHVLERERMFGALSKKRSAKAEEEKYEGFHVRSSHFVILSEVEESLIISVFESVSGQKYLEMSPLRST